MAIQSALFDLVNPAPWQGHSETTRDASKSGAVVANQKRGPRIALVLSTIREHQPITRQNIAVLTGLPINSVCSLLGALLEQGQVEECGSREWVWGDGKVTRRTLYRCSR